MYNNNVITTSELFQLFAINRVSFRAPLSGGMPLVILSDTFVMQRGPCGCILASTILSFQSSELFVTNNWLIRRYVAAFTSRKILTIVVRLARINGELTRVIDTPRVPDRIIYDE